VDYAFIILTVLLGQQINFTMPPKAEILAGLASHDASTILEIIKRDSTWENVNALAYSFMEVAQAHPGDVDKIANTILTVQNSPDAQTIEIKNGDDDDEPIQLRYLLTDELHDMLATAFSYENISSITPQNPSLIAAMISGACARTKLTDSATQAGLVTRGLQFKDSEYEDYVTQDEYEAYALHACLQLLVGGEVGFKTGQTRYDKEDVLPALKSIAKKGIIKYENGKRLLQVRSLKYCDRLIHN
jgi:hypothetical protein